MRLTPGKTSLAMVVTLFKATVAVAAPLSSAIATPPIRKRLSTDPRLSRRPGRARRDHGYARLRAEPAKSRPAGPGALRAAGGGWLHGDLHPGGEHRQRRRYQPRPQPRLERVAHLRGDLPGLVCRRTPGDPLCPTHRRPLSVPAGSGGGKRGNCDGLP